MKTLIHSKVPLNNGKVSVPLEQIERWMNSTKELLGEDYVLIISPFETTKIDGDAPLIYIDYKQYSHNELMEIIEKASMYDGLCK